MSKIDIKSWASAAAGLPVEVAPVKPATAFQAPAGYSVGAYADIAYSMTPSSGMLVVSTGRMSRSDVHKILLPVPARLYERIAKNSSGSITNVVNGLLVYAVDQLEKEGKTLNISL